MLLGDPWGGFGVLVGHSSLQKSNEHRESRHGSNPSIGLERMKRIHLLPSPSTPRDLPYHSSPSRRTTTSRCGNFECMSTKFSIQDISQDTLPYHTYQSSPLTVQDTNSQTLSPTWHFKRPFRYNIHRNMIFPCTILTKSRPPRPQQNKNTKYYTALVHPPSTTHSLTTCNRVKSTKHHPPSFKIQAIPLS